MKNDNTFRTTEQELEKLFREIADVRTAIREIGATINRMERHVRRAFDPPKTSPRKAAPKRGSDTGIIRGEKPATSAKEALGMFDDLAALFAQGKRVDVQSRLERMSVSELQLLAHELGVVHRSRPSRNLLCSGITRRLHERNLLSKNVNVTRPLAEGMTETEPAASTG